MPDQKASVDPEAAVSDLDTGLYALAFRGTTQLRIGMARFRQWLGIDRITNENVQTAAYALALTDVDTLLRISSASAVVVTIPPNAGVAFPLRSSIPILRYGTGSVTIAQGAGVTLRPGNNQALRAQYSVATLLKIGTDEWVAFGDLA